MGGSERAVGTLAEGTGNGMLDLAGEPVLDVLPQPVLRRPYESARCVQLTVYLTLRTGAMRPDTDARHNCPGVEERVR